MDLNLISCPYIKQSDNKTNVLEKHNTNIRT